MGGVEAAGWEEWANTYHEKLKVPGIVSSYECELMSRLVRSGVFAGSIRETASSDCRGRKCVQGEKEACG